MLSGPWWRISAALFGTEQCGILNPEVLTLTPGTPCICNSQPFIDWFGNDILILLTSPPLLID
jgi:hypothetical protein